MSTRMDLTENDVFTQRDIVFIERLRKTLEQFPGALEMCILEIEPDAKDQTKNMVVSVEFPPIVGDEGIWNAMRHLNQLSDKIDMTAQINGPELERLKSTIPPVSRQHGH